MYQSDRDEPYDPLSKRLWVQVPELIRRDFEQHVLAHLPADLLAKWRDQHARGVCIGSELTACCGFGGDWDNCYIGVLAAIAAMRQ
jgi:hypothetical protein